MRKEPHMDLSNIFDARLGGKARAYVVTFIGVVAWLAWILGQIDVDAPIGVTTPLVLQLIAHGTPFGNRES